MDTININNLKFFGYHGVGKDERRDGNDFSIDVFLEYDLKKAGKSDKLTDTINYADVCRYISVAQSRKKYKLLEALADDLAKGILTKFKPERVRIILRKHNIKSLSNLDSVSVEIERGKS